MPRSVQQLCIGTLVGLIGGFMLGGLLGALLHNRSVVREGHKYIANRLPPTDLSTSGS